ncbi:MAG: hypothetical protein NTZ18_01740 [Candidatus Komeilibacteria bacterium]|nr:hypothetical protein [Candidatus Komeilibacteria bacterium]
MEKIIGLKELRQNMPSFAQKVQKGQSFIVVKQSKPLFKITPLTYLDNEVEQSQQSAFLQTGAIDSHRTLKPLSKEEHDYYMGL